MEMIEVIGNILIYKTDEEKAVTLFHGQHSQCNDKFNGAKRSRSRICHFCGRLIPKHPFNDDSISIYISILNN